MNINGFLARAFFLLITMLALSFNLVANGEARKVVSPGYNITASDTHKFVWFRVAKAGTRSILRILQENTKLSVDAYGIPFRPSRYADYFKFAFVRNPWDRVVSTYCNKVLTRKHLPFQACYGKSFDYFVDFIDKQDLVNTDVHIMLQTKLIPLNFVDFIGRFEQFTDDLQVVLQVIGLEGIDIPHINASTHSHYSHYYSERTKKIIGKKYKADIDAFDYAFEDSF